MSDSAPAFDVGRFARILTLIAGVTAVSLLTSASVLPSDVQSIGFVAIGAIALVTAMTGFLVSVGSAYDASMVADEAVKRSKQDR